ncbi:MAG: SpoIIE family protein phosphatase [Coriobacteriia bacterium]|nr:SpoIIE family protein phosphatase [Coriobacteriia bacterium]
MRAEDRLVSLRAVPPWVRSRTWTVPIGVLLALAVVLVGLVDARTGLVPDLTIVYLVPVLSATVWRGLRGGLAVAVFATVVEALAGPAVPRMEPVAWAADTVTHFAVFLLAVLLLDRVLRQLDQLVEREAARRRDFEIARDVQQSLLSGSAGHVPGLDVASRITYAREVGGDYYLVRREDGRLVFAVADISGKGSAASLFTAVLHQSLTDSVSAGRGLSETMSRANVTMSRLLPSTMFITAFFATVTPEELSFIDAGHVPPLLVRADGRSELLASAGVLPLGIESDVRYDPRTRVLGPGDVVLAVTDGITDRLSLDVDESLDILAEVVRAHMDEDVAAIADAVLASALAHRRVDDDAALVCVKVTSSRAG